MAMTALAVLVCVFGAALCGMLLRRMLPEHHLSSDTKEVVKLAMGFVATMAALILGLLVASAKDSFDKQSAGVTQMAANIIYLDRLLDNYGPETKEIRVAYRGVLEEVTKQMWPERASGNSELDPSATHSESVFTSIQALDPKTDLQRTLKDKAVSTILELGQMRWQEYEQAATSASATLIYALVFWLSILFASFTIFSPSNSTVVAAMLLAALSVSAAIFLILELRSPFTGIVQIPNTQFLDAISHLGK
jgi:hypothetical protein